MRDLEVRKCDPVYLNSCAEHCGLFARCQSSSLSIRTGETTLLQVRRMYLPMCWFEHA
jgi:hypothetical protein